MDYVALEKQLTEHEAERLKIYKCPAGKWSIGVGRNLEDRGITHAEARYLLRNDIFEAERQLKALAFWDGLSEIRQRVLVDMVHNLGFAGLLQFKRMLDALAHNNYDGAADEMLRSRWAIQVGKRAIRLSAMMRKDIEVDLA